MGIFQDALNLIVEFAILVFEYIGVAVILMAGIKGVVNYVTRNPKTRLDLAKGLAMGLEFKLGSEILRTVVVREMTELVFVAGIIALRAVLTVLIQQYSFNHHNCSLYHTIRLFFSHRDSIFVAERDPDEKYGRKR